MNLLSRTATAVVTSLALGVPVGAIASTAQAQPSAPSTSETHTQALAKKAKKPALKLKRSAAYSHVGQPGVKVTAVVRKGVRGKVAFSVNGGKARKVRIKKGKASFRLPSTNPAGVYQVTAKVKGAKKSVKVRVYNSAIKVSATTFTISKSTDSWDLPGLTGSVVFKGTPAKKGWVDIYQDGRKKNGSSSPFYCCMTSVATNGTFQFSPSTFLGRVQEKAPGTYTYQAFYTDGPAYADYIYSTPIKVTVTP